MKTGFRSLTLLSTVILLGAVPGSSILAAEIYPSGDTSVVLVDQGQSDYSVTLPSSADPVIQFAAEELVHYVEKISGARMKIISASPFPEKVICLQVSSLLPLDAYSLVVRPPQIQISGGNSRGCLYGVYDLLRLFEVVWFGPGEENEWVPHIERLVLPALERVQQPSFPGRGYSYAINAWDGEDCLRFVDWMAKNKMNYIVIAHYHECTIENSWVKERDKILPEFRKRGMVLGLGGHLLPKLLPRDLFQEHPEYFRMDAQGRRTNDHNLNPFHAKALEIIGHSAVNYAQRFPETTIWHFFPDDLHSGGWDESEKGKHYSPSDQGLLAVNAISRALESEAPWAYTAHIAYHDTLLPPGQVQPYWRSHLLFAPRERCYGHAIDDPACAANRTYRDSIVEEMKVFSLGHVHEYYGDSYLYRGFSIPILTIIAEDLRFYRAQDLHTIHTLMFPTQDSSSAPLMEHHSYIAYPVNLYAIPQLLWNVNEPVENILTDYCRAKYPGVAKEMVDYITLLESAARKVLTVCEYPGYSDWWLPPKSAFNAIHLANLEKALGEMEEGDRILDSLLKEVQDEKVKSRIHGQSGALQYTLNQSRSLLKRLRELTSGK